MSTRAQFNTKNPTIKRILKEASELASNASPDYHAEPLEDNLFEWHFTLRGPPSPSPYATGTYHGRIILPPSYPLRPPSFRFLTPTGRFEVNREICLSISGHHEETWQPAWGIRTALVAIRSFMDTDAKGQLGGLDCSEDVRKRLARESVSYKCARCGKSNQEILREREQAASLNDGVSKEESVPEELRLAYREDCNSGSSTAPQEQSLASTRLTTPGSIGQPTSARTVTQVSRSPSGSIPAQASHNSQASSADIPVKTWSASSPAQRSNQPLPRAEPTQSAIASTEHSQGVPNWVDLAIYGIVAALVFMLARKILGI